MKDRNKVLVAALVVFLLGLGFCFGIYYRDNTTEPEIETIIEYVPIEVVREVEIPTVVIKEVPVEVIRETAVIASDWNSLDELWAFLEVDKTDEIPMSDNWKCRDAMRTLSDNALKINKCIDTAWIFWEEYNHYFPNNPLEPPTFHALNVAYVGSRGQNVYLVESYLRDDVAFITRLSHPLDSGEGGVR